MNHWANATHPHLVARSAKLVNVLPFSNGKPFVRESGIGCYHLLCKDELGCYVFAPCDKDGEPYPPTR